MPTIKEDKKCPKCGNIDEQSIDESFSHFDDAFHFEYQCRLCRCFWRRTFEYVGLEVRKDKAWYATEAIK